MPARYSAAAMPGSIRLFTTAALADAATVALDHAQAHQLRVVMRRRVGDPVALWNGRDGEWEGRVDHLDRDRATVVLVRRTRPQVASPDCWLLAAPIRRDLFELVTQKATELGASQLWPVLTRRTNPGRPNEVRLRTIATEAAEQSERLDVPIIRPAMPLADALAGWEPERTLFVAAERVDAPALPPMRGPCALLVGPEGGFDTTELDALARLAFVQVASLGRRILRAETAAIAGLARLLAHPA